jgi:hypothetical protein
MPGERRQRILERLVGGGGRGFETKRLCVVGADITHLTGAGIMLMSGDIPRGSVCTSNEASALIEQLQFELGEGPCVDAHRHHRPVLEEDLAKPARVRWPAFTQPALAAGVRAVFGFPMQVGAARLGALNLYRDAPGQLTDDQHSDALVMSSVASEIVLLLQAGAAPGQLAAELEAGADFQYVVHQAAGMIAAQLEVSIAEALIRLRAYAFGNDRPLAAVAQDIVNRVLRFHDGDDP